MKNFTWIKAFFSPFKRPKLYWHFGERAIGTPYFYPHKWVKFTHQDRVEAANRAINDPKWIQKSYNEWYEYYRNYSKPVTLKVGFSYCDLGWKTKWSDTDYRHEWDPTFSFVFFNWQIALRIIPDYRDHYWETWLFYELNTDKTKSIEYRIQQCKSSFPNIWESNDSNGKTITNYYDLILKHKYL